MKPQELPNLPGSRYRADDEVALQDKLEIVSDHCETPHHFHEIFKISENFKNVLLVANYVG